MTKGILKSTASMAAKTVVIVLTIAALVLAFSLVQSKVRGGEPSVLGCRMYIVLSGSMSPAIETGSLVVVKPAAPESIRVGDIITFGGGGSSVTTHRVTAVENEGGLSFRTKGDANEVEDPLPVSADRLVGKVVFSIPYAGYVFSYARTRKGAMTIIALASAVILAELIRTMIRGGRNKSRQDGKA